MAQGGEGKIFYMCDSENEECDADWGTNKLSPDADMEEDFKMKPSSSLQMILTSISQARSRECTFVSHDSDFVLVQADNFWVQLFTKHFLEAPEDTNKDDLLFYVRKTTAKSRLNIPQTEIEVYRKSSSSQPGVEDVQIDWEETVYLNLILQHLEYYVTCAICSRTGEKELQILKKFSQRVYASPSRRRMDTKGTEEEIVYPNIFFTVDNFEEAFADIVVRDSEMVCVELVAQDRHAAFQGVIFLGSIRYEALKKIYDARASLTHRMAQRMSLSWFKGHKRVEFVRMRGPLGKGHAEMAVSRQKGSGPETPDQTPSTEQFSVEDFENQGVDASFSHRRMSDPNVSWHNFGRGSYKRAGMRKTCSETENVDAIGTSNCEEVEADSIEDAFDENFENYNGFFGKSFGQAWHWFKEKRRSNSVALHAYLTYVTLPWHRIIADLCEEDSPLMKPVLADLEAGSAFQLSA